jgi:putative transcriptional regulator
MKNKVKAMMDKRKMTSTELAYKSNISERYVFFIMQGSRSPSLKVALRLAKALNCKVEDIFLPNDSTKRTRTATA